MKIRLLFLSLLGSIGLANAQFTVTNTAGETLTEGTVIQSSLEYTYDFFVTNDNPSQEIFTRIEVYDIINATGDRFELCYGECITGVVLGQHVPPVPSTVAIPVGGVTGMGNHFLNFDSGDGTNLVDYIFKFRQYEADGTTEIGTPITITYRYDPALGVAETSKVNLSIQSTIVSDQLVLTVNEPVEMMIYDIQGRMVKQARFESGNQVVNVSDLSTQTYIVQFKNNNGAVQTTKIMVQ